VVAYWPIERFSGWRHHGASVVDEDAAMALIASLLASVGVDVGDVVEFWGTPGIGGDRYVEVADELPDVDLPPHSLAHIFSCALLDTDVAWKKPILAMAVDGGADPVLAKKNYGGAFAGAYIQAGKFNWFRVESPARLFTAARHRYGLREGTLMALATAATCDAKLDELCGERCRVFRSSGLPRSYSWSASASSERCTRPSSTPWQRVAVRLTSGSARMSR
jgi:carbamoyltransferase